MKRYIKPNADMIYFETQDIMTGSKDQLMSDPLDPFVYNPWGGLDLSIPE